MSEPIRVLNVVGRMGAGGIEALIMNLYRHMDRERVQFDFLTHKGSGGIYEDEIRRLGGRIYEMPVLRQGNRTYYWRVLTYRRALKRFFAAHPEYHVLHGHMTNLASIYMPIAKKHGRVTCAIAHSHLTQARPGLSGVVTDLLHRGVPRVATDYFACSEMAAHWIFSDADIAAGKVRIIRNGVDPARFCYSRERAQRLRRELGLEGRFVMGNVARFKTEKNHAFQLEVLREVVQMQPDTVLLLVGDGELRPEIERKARDMGLDGHVRLMGLRQDVPELMAAMDLFLLPSLYEGLPVAGMEAQAAGLPVVTSTGVTTEMDITGNVSFLDLQLGAKAWADRIVELHRTFERKDTSALIRAAGYDITETAAWLEQFYLTKHEEGA